MRSTVAIAVGLAMIAVGCSGDGSDRSLSQGRTQPLVAQSGEDVQSGLSVTGYGSVVVPADIAYVTFTSIEYESTLSPEDYRDLHDGLIGAGVPDDDIEIYTATDPYAASVAARVRLDVDADLAQRAERIDEVAADAVGDELAGGLTFGVTDCVEALEPARMAALDEAERSARSLAEAAGLHLGDLRSVVEVPSGAEPFAANPCNPSPVSATGFEVVAQPYDAPAEVTLWYVAQVTYEIADAETSRALTAAGTATVTARADLATVVVGTYRLFDPSGGSGNDDEQRDRIVDALSVLSIEEDDIEIVDSPYVGSGPLVLVHLDAERVQELGDEIVDAVEAVTDAIERQGVVYSSSECTRLMENARAAAFEHAERELEALADAADVQLGPVTAITTQTISSMYGYAGLADLDPCDLSAALDWNPSNPYPTIVGFEAAAEVNVSGSVAVSRAIASE